MWLMTTLGMFSVVCAKKPDKTLDESKVMIRVRFREHLENLKNRFPNELGNCVVLESQDTDYRWRIICDKAIFSTCLSVLMLDVNYSNFKDECLKKFGHNEYLNALHQTWGVFFDAGEKHLNPKSWSFDKW